MRRGDLYRVHKPGGDPKRFRVFVVVSRQPLIDSTFSSLICAPVLTYAAGLTTQVGVGTD
jgi:mRNA interferase MazF